MRFSTVLGITAAACLVLQALVQTIPAQDAPPELSIGRLDESYFNLQWPSTATDYLLEQAPLLTLDPATWTAVSQTPILNGDAFSLTLAFDFESQFYRLRFDPDQANHPPQLEPVPDSQVMPGSSLTIQLFAADADAEDVLTFGVLPLPLPENAALNALTGVFTFKPGTAQAGDYQFTFSVTDGRFTSEQSATFTVLDPPVNGQTVLSGFVYDADAEEAGMTIPIAGVVVSLLDTNRSAVTAADGSFRITLAPDGVQVLDFDTSTAVPGPGGAAYAAFRERYPLIAAVDNVIERPIYLPRLAAASLTTVDPDAETVVSNDTLGVSIHVPPHTAKAEDGSDFTGQLSISLVPRDLAPMPLPDLLDPALLVTIQPVGVTFSTPIPITYPNLDGLAPGSEVDLWSLDPDSGQFAIVGKGQVSADGQRIETIEGGVRAADWHAPLPPSNPPVPPQDDPPDNEHPEDDCETDSGSRVAQASGSLTTGFLLPAYLSLNQERALEFVYETERAYPYPLIPAELVVPIASAVPLSVSYRMIFGGVDLGSERYIDTSGFNEDADEPFRVSLGCDASLLSTGSYPYSLRVTSNFASSRVSADRRGRLHIVNEQSSPFGAGWGLAGLQRIIANGDGTLLLVDGGGASIFFDRGDRRDLLVQNSANNQNNAILRYHETTGELLGFFVQPGAGGLMGAHNPTFGPDGNLYIVSQGPRILRFDGQTGEFIDQFADASPHQSGLAQMAFGPDGNLYTDLGGPNGRQALRYSGADGSFLGVAAEGNAIQRVCGIAFGPDGMLYLADQDPFANTAYDRILRFNPANSQFVGVFVPSGNLDDTCPFEFGSDGHIYIADQRTRDIRRFNGDTGAFMGVFASGPPITVPSTPFYARSGPDGLLYVANAAGVHRYREEGAAGVFVDTFVNGNTGFFTFMGERPGGVAERYQSPPGDNSVLVCRFDGSFTRTLPDGDVYQFNSAGLLVAHTDSNQNTTTYTYDEQSRLMEITDPAGLQTTFAYSGASLARVADPAGRVTTFTHSPLGDLARVAFPDGSTRAFGYDDRHLMTAETSPRGFTVQREFDFTGRFLRSELPDGSSRQGTNARSTGLLDPASDEGSAGNPAPVTRPEETFATFTDGEDVSTSYQVGAFGEAVRVVDAVGLATELERDFDGNLVRYTQPAGRVQISTFDALGNLLSEEDSAFGGTITQTYEPGSHRVSTSTDPFGKTTQFAYDASGNLTGLTTPLGRQFANTYDSRGLILSSTEPSGALRGFAYDERGNLVRSTLGTNADPGLRETAYTLTAAGRIASMTTAGASTLFTYDPFNRLTSLQPPAPSGVAGYEWDAIGNMISLTPPGRPAHHFTYTAMNQVAEYLPPSVGQGDPASRMTYDRAQRLTNIDRPDGKQLRFAYDPAGRLATVESAAGLTEYHYDPAAGTLSTIETPEGVALEMTYNAGQVAEIRWAGEVQGSVSFTYDPTGRRQSVQVNSRPPIASTYDDDGLQTGLGALTLIRHPQTGLVSSAQLGQLRTEFEYNFAGEKTAARTFLSDALLHSAEYRRNALGQIDQVAETTNGGPPSVRSFTYEPNGWLIASTENGVDRERFTYDGNGNRLSALGLAPAPTYDAQDRLLSYGTLDFTYSANGEWTARTSAAAITRFEYDEATNLRNVELPSGTRIDYVIDGEQRRIGRKTAGTLTQAFLYQDAEEPVAELDGSSNVAAEFAYLNGANAPAFMLKNGRTYRILTDPNGSIRLVIDSASGDILQRLDYDAFGNLLADSNPGFQPFGFAGGICDRDTGLVRFGARDYDPATGRWTAKDPILFSGGHSNLYLYSKNDPVNAADPSGNAPEKTQKEKDWDEIKRKMDKKEKDAYTDFDEFKKDWDKFKKDHWNFWERNNPFDSNNPDFLNHLNMANNYAQTNWNNGVGP